VEGLRSVGRDSAAVARDGSRGDDAGIESEDQLRSERGPGQCGGGVVADLGVSVRTVWRWLEQAEGEGRMVRKVRVQFVVEQEDLVELAYHRGNVEAVYRARVAAGRDVRSGCVAAGVCPRPVPGPAGGARGR